LKIFNPYEKQLRFGRFGRFEKLGSFTCRCDIGAGFLTGDMPEVKV
jgi:hypothetical protein